MIKIKIGSKIQMNEIVQQRDLTGYAEIYDGHPFIQLLRRPVNGWEEISPIDFYYTTDASYPQDEQDIYVNIATPIQPEDIQDAIARFGEEDARDFTHKELEKCCYEDFKEGYGEAATHVGPGVLVLLTCQSHVFDQYKNRFREIVYISWDGDDFRQFVRNLPGQKARRPVDLSKVDLSKP